MPAIAAAPDLREGLSLTEWQELHLWLVTDLAQRVPFLDTPSQHVLEREIGRAHRECAAKHAPTRGIAVKPRRSGWTSKFLARFYTRCRTEEFTKFNYIAKTEGDQKKQMATVHTFHKNLDQRLVLPLENPNALLELSYPSLGSKIESSTASSSGSGRGSGYAEQLWDEVPFSRLNIFEQEVLLSGLLEASRVTPLWMLSTPNGRNDVFWKTWDESARGENDWVRIFCPHWVDHQCRSGWEAGSVPLTTAEVLDVLETRTDEEKHAVEQFHRRYGARFGTVLEGRELAERLHWRRLKKRSLKELFPQEYPEDEDTCWVVQGFNFFDLQAISRQHAEAKQPLRTDYGGALVVYVEPEKGHNYIVSVDAGAGVGRDASVALVLDAETCEVVAELSSKHLDTTQFVEIAIKSLCLPYHRALLAPENNSIGDGMVNHARRSLGYYPIYRHRPNRLAARPDLRYGFPTTGPSRVAALERLRSALQADEVVVNSPRVLSEALSFKLSGSSAEDRYEAEKGANDDHIMALAIAMYVQRTGHWNTKPVWGRPK